MSYDQEALVLGDENSTYVRVHVTAVFEMLNAFSRRPTKHDRVIGTLLGFVREGFVEVTECFGVPHVERTEDLYVAINKDYHKSMFNFHRLVNRREQIVGWFTTTLPENIAINDNSSLIHEFYADECDNPVHLVVDTALHGEIMGLRGYFSQPMMIGESPLANMFHEVRVEVGLSESETTSIYHMLKGQDNTWESTKIVSAIPSESVSLQASMQRLIDLIDNVMLYVDAVIAGKKEPNIAAGIELSSILSSVKAVHPEAFHEVFQGKIQDLLMMTYLSTLTQTQVTIAEKLNLII